MITLGIESTAHTFGVGIVEDGTILANVKSAYEPDEGGIHPRKASEHHYANAKQTIDNAISKADISEEDIDLVAFSQGPGIPQCLQIGGTAARSLSQKLGVPLVGVNHCIAHIEVGKLETGAEDPVTLYVSGGNSQIIAYAGGKYRIFGETLDIAIGNAIDKFARSIDIPHPGGPRIEELAEKSENLVELPYVVKGMDFSFSGLVTRLQQMLGDYDEEDLCYSFQEYAFAMLVEATERAIAHLDKDEVLVTGGVAANKRLQEMLEVMAKERGANSYKVPNEYAMDNGAMIAYTGQLKYNSKGETEINRSGIKPDWRTDQVEADWNG
ncbi:MAG: bifunctional N(6)-L-threonylcarbamoyladenine synthase/serine/threonine protein kinase [Candidatus Nanohaloarchaeota archaeon QJJ-9]|nr:bifunctional N(6)-L-threonylcarbamoyladenine synthase/serine/threonine protein kinase [Candidatus Nanohaloarchaeota archaeon QJJ-9]